MSNEIEELVSVKIVACKCKLYRNVKVNLNKMKPESEFEEFNQEVEANIYDLCAVEEFVMNSEQRIWLCTCKFRK